MDKFIKRSTPLALCLMVLILTINASTAKTEELPSLYKLVKHFEVLVFGNEIDPGNASKRLAKWTNSLAISVQGKFKRHHIEQLKDHLKALREETGLRFRWVKPKQDGNNVYLLFLPRKQMATIEIPGVPQSLIRKLAAPGGCYFITAKNEFSEITRAWIVVNAERQEHGIKHCLLEEFAQVLGLPNDTDRLRPSLFSDRDQLTKLGKVDKIMLQTLYDPRMLPDMTRAEARDTAWQIISEILEGTHKPDRNRS